MKRQKNNCLVLETFKKSVRNIGIPTDPYGIMHPDYINYAIIDPPLRKLIKTINRSSWARYFNFYLRGFKYLFIMRKN